MSLAAQKNFRISDFEIVERSDEGFPGKLFVTVNGKRKKIADSTPDAWIVSDGREIVYSGSDGAGGYENEGQSLRIYNAATGETRKIMSQYTYVVGLTEKKLSGGASVLLIRMGDGGLGGSYFAVVDPRRGEIFYQRFAELTSVEGDAITLAFYDERDWEDIGGERGWNYVNKTAIPKPTKIKPEKTVKYDLKKILKNKVIFNRNSNEIIAEEIDKYNKNFKDVVVYLWHPNETPPEGKNYFLMAVSKNISRRNAVAPLRPTLELLFSGAGEADVRDGFASPTFGMKFEGVTLKDGTAIIKFSQPPNQTNYGSLGAFIFAEAVEKTAKQFPTVKKVELCAIGETLIDAQLEKPFPKCR